MCVVVFLGTDAPAPLVPWDESRRGFNVSPIEERETPVRDKFSTAHVCVVGAHTHCGCGFRSLNLQPDGGHLPVEYAEVEEPELSAADHRALAAYLRERLAEQDVVELYVCWDGDWAEEVVERVEVTPEDVAEETFFFEERGFYRVAG